MGRFVIVAVLATSAICAFTTSSAKAQTDPNGDLRIRLQSPDPAVLAEALKSFKQAGPKAAAAVPALRAIVNPANPPVGTRAEAQGVLSACSALYRIGTDEAYEIVSQAFHVITKRSREDFEEGREQNRYDVELNNRLGLILDLEWPNTKPPRNTPPEKMTVQQLHDYIWMIEGEIAKGKGFLQVAEQSIRNFEPGSLDWISLQGKIRGWHEAMPVWENRLVEAKGLLAAKELRPTK